MILNRPPLGLVASMSALLVAGGSTLGCSNMTDERADSPPRATGESWVGRWQRLGGEPCVDAYPERIELRADGVYLADSDDSRFREWQAGDYEVRGAEIRMQMSNDAMAPFDLSLPARDRLVFTAGDGCRIEYRRLR